MEAPSPERIGMPQCCDPEAKANRSLWRKRISLRVHDRETDKLKVLHFSNPYPAEYRLGGEIPDELSRLAEARETIAASTYHHRSVMHWFVFAAMLCIGGGIVLRRI